MPRKPCLIPILVQRPFTIQLTEIENVFRMYEMNKQTHGGQAKSTFYHLYRSDCFKLPIHQENMSMTRGPMVL